MALSRGEACSLIVSCVVSVLQFHELIPRISRRELFLKLDLSRVLVQSKVPIATLVDPAFTTKAVSVQVVALLTKLRANSSSHRLFYLRLYSVAPRIPLRDRLVVDVVELTLELALEPTVVIILEQNIRYLVHIPLRYHLPCVLRLEVQGRPVLVLKLLTAQDQKLRSLLTILINKN